MIKKNDIPACLNLYNWYIENTTITFETKPLTISEFQERVMQVRKQYPWIVKEEDGKLIGYAYLSHFNEREAYDWSADVSIYLDHEARGKGYGKQLMKELIHLAEVDGYRKLVSLVTSGNTVSEHMHEAFGFVKKAELEDTGYKFGQWLGVSFYVKDVDGFSLERIERPKNLNPYEGDVK